MLRWTRGTLLTVAFGALLALGCGDSGSGNRDGGSNPGEDGSSNPGDDSGTNPGEDGGGPTVDGAVLPNCTPGTTQCSDCVDNEAEPDGFIDGNDPHCAGPADNDESSFATGIPGDNSDPKKQDCFFDGDSGGDQIETCCLLGKELCDAANGEFGDWSENMDCEFDEEECAEATPAGCDCFGCCTVCNPETGDCSDVMTSPAISPECDPADIGTATADECVACTKFETCNGGECNEDPDDCILCPGETEEDLPDSCNEQNECPGDAMVCASTDDCGSGQYCSTGCCVSVVD